MTAVRLSTFVVDASTSRASLGESRETSASPSLLVAFAAVSDRISGLEIIKNR